MRLRASDRRYGDGGRSSCRTRRSPSLVWFGFFEVSASFHLNFQNACDRTFSHTLLSNSGGCRGARRRLVELKHPSVDGREPAGAPWRWSLRKQGRLSCVFTPIWYTPPAFNAASPPSTLGYLDGGVVWVSVFACSLHTERSVIVETIKDIRIQQVFHGSTPLRIGGNF
jgi:hypothetical protein